MKRTFDVLVSVIVLTVSLLPAAIISFIIKLTSKGPVFFIQTRVGKGGKPFSLYKFRTMNLNSDGPMVTADEDIRITWIGKFLRKWKIDELPQFINVLKGEMSLIGPRPETERFVRAYTSEQRKILAQTPGLAGMAQLVYPHESGLLKGHPNPEEAYIKDIMPKKIHVDLEYEKVRTFGSDILLLMEMALFVFGKSFRQDHSLHLTTVFDRSRVG